MRKSRLTRLLAGVLAIVSPLRLRRQQVVILVDHRASGASTTVAPATTARRSKGARSPSVNTAGRTSRSDEAQRGARSAAASSPRSTTR